MLFRSCQNDTTQHPQDASSVYYHNTFQSLGLSWKVDKLAQVVKHARPEYYRNMRGYIRALAPKSTYGDSWTEQDGLINRLAELSDVKCLYPYVPRAFHAGFVGYNRRGTPLDGSREERIAALKSMSAEDMNNHAIEYKDITPIDTIIDHQVKEYVLK